MRAAVLLALIMLAGCSRTLNRFEVHAPGAASAELQLCGKTTSLKRSGDTFVEVRAICGEADGAIFVRFPDRPPAECIVGYVTTGAVQTFRFTVEHGQCSQADTKISTAYPY